MACVYRHKGDYDLALKYYQESLEIDKKCHTSEHAIIPDTLNDIGLVYEAKGDSTRASKYFL
jgi:tetratricopeptide (TPR) repeat protein